MKIVHPYKIELARTLAGHWYNVWLHKRKIGTFVSSTTILLAYPTNEYLTKWIADRGFHESKQIRDEAGHKGQRVHSAIERLLDGETIFIEDYTDEEFYKLSTFVDWWREYKPEMITKEMPVFSKKYKYCGRLDYVCKIKELGIVVLDFKTSNHIHPQFSLQFASYAQALEEMTDLKIANTAVLQLGTRRNKKGYRFETYPDWKEHLKTFLAVKKVWDFEHSGEKENPPVLELPESLKLNKF